MIRRLGFQSRMPLAGLAAIALVAAACGASAGTAAPSVGGGNGAGQSGAGQSGGGNGQSGGQQPGGAPADMCSVLTDAQVASAMGVSLGAGAPQNDGQMCLWQDATKGQADISIDNGGATFDGLCSLTGSTIKVDGVGDRACFVEAGKLATMLEFEKGGQLYTMHVFLPSGTVQSIEAVEKVLAQQAASKL